MVDLHVYPSLDELFRQNPDPDLWLATTKAPRHYAQARFRDGCWLFFGKETAGLPQDFRERYYERCIRIPMRADARSLNLANSVAILTYEALRQQGFPELSGVGEMARPSASAPSHSLASRWPQTSKQAPSYVHDTIIFPGGRVPFPPCYFAKGDYEA